MSCLGVKEMEDDSLRCVTCGYVTDDYNFALDDIPCPNCGHSVYEEL